MRNHLKVAGLAALAAVTAFSATLEPGKTEIVVAKGAAPVVTFAAKELKHFLDGVLSCDVPVVAAPTAGRTPIHLGADEWTRAAGICVDGFARDAFRIVVTDGAVFIAGRDDPKANPERAMQKNVWLQHYERATLFGAYEFLERYAGVRMYFPGELGEIVPKSARLEIAPADFTVAPNMTGRHYSFFGEGVWFEGEKRDSASTGPLRWLHSYRLRMQTESVPFCHGLSHRNYVRRFHKTHPEYFCLKADGTRDINLAVRHTGQLCHTSGIWEEIYQDAKSYLMGEKADVRGVLNPHGKVGWWYSCQGGKYIDLMPADGMVRCTCANCEAAYDRDDPGNYMDTMIWTQMAKVGNRLIKEGVPGFVTQMAYQPYRRVPDVDLPTNVLVMVAERGPWSVPYPDQMKREQEEIAAWSRKLGHRVAIWTYPCKYGKRKVPDIPDMSPWMWGKYYRAVAPWVNHIYAESETDRFLYLHLDYYVLSRVTWDPRVDTDAVIAEYFRLMYGPAAGEMEEIFRSMEKKWTTGFLAQAEDTMWGPTFRPVSPEDCWNEVYGAKTLARYAELFSAAEAKTAEGSLERRRVALMRRELLDPLAAAHEAFQKRGERLAAVNFRFGGNRPLVLRGLRPRSRTVADNLRTEVTAEARDGGLAVHVVAYEPEMARVAATERKFDDTDVWQENGIELMVDPTGSRREFMHFMVNAAGSVADLIHRKNDTKRWAGDKSWNAGAKVTVQRFGDRWTCDIEIPASAFRDGLPSRFPAELFRNRTLLGDLRGMWSIWSPYATGPCDFDNFGTWELK